MEGRKVKGDKASWEGGFGKAREIKGQGEAQGEPEEGRLRRRKELRVEEKSWKAVNLTALSTAVGENEEGGGGGKEVGRGENT